MSTYAYPFPSGSGNVGRTDQGVDFSGPGAVDAVGAGTIEALSNAGWPGGTYILEKLLHPFAGHTYVYYAEDITPGVRIGQNVTAGQKIGQATGGPSGIEIGWGTATAGQTYAAAHGGYTEGEVTAAGSSFRSFIGQILGGKMAQTPSGSHTSTSTQTPTATPGGLSTAVAAASPSGASTGPSAAQLTSAAGPGHSVFTRLLFAFLGVAALSLVASFNDKLGQALEAIMIGFVIMWFLLHYAQFGSWIAAASGGTAGTPQGSSQGPQGATGGTSGGFWSCPGTNPVSKALCWIAGH